MPKKEVVKKASARNEVGSKQSKGGKARAAKLTPEERSASAKRAADSRWKKDLPRAAYSGPLRVGDIEFDCAVVKDGDRVLRLVSETRFMEAMGMYRSGALSTRRGAHEPLFLAYKNLRPFVEKHLASVHFEPFRYITEGGSVAHGIPDEIIPKVCEVWIDADREGVLGPRQELIAERADILLRGFAHVGLRALIDEATGFQYERPRRDLQEYLGKLLAEGLVRWVRSFPHDYFKHLCRLRGVELRPDMRLPQYFGHLTNDLVYRRIAPGLLRALKERRIERGRASDKLHWWTSEELGHPTLLLHLGTVVGLMKIHDDYEAFKAQLDEIAPVYPETPGLFDDPGDWELAQ
ncbi:MAG: P63C domain-containing protein [Phycisphaerales bacterium JB039]